MKKEKISMVIGELDNRHIEDALYCGKHVFFDGWKRWQKVAVCAAFIVLFFISITGVAFVSNAEFRKVVVKFVSSFSEEERVQIRDGHLTGSLDTIDVLIDFLHEFNDNDMGNGVVAKYDENGFDYIVLKENSKNIDIIVNCESEHFKLLVNMAGEEIEEGAYAWKVSSYQLISYEEADELLKLFPNESITKTIEGENIETKDDPKDSVIKADKQHGKIYNALHKEEENIIILTIEETVKLKSIVESYTNDEIGWEGQDYNYIILFDETDYMITEDGFVIKKDKNSTIAFKMKSRDLKKVMNMFKKYKIKY